MKLNYIDDGNEFDFGKVSDEYAKYRDIYPKSMYDKLISFGIGKQGQSTPSAGDGIAPRGTAKAKRGAGSHAGAEHRVQGAASPRAGAELSSSAIWPRDRS